MRQGYLGTTVTRDNLIEEEIKERIAAGNRASFANQKTLQSKLISEKTKMKFDVWLTVHRNSVWIRKTN